MPWAPGSKAKPRHVDLLTQLGNLTPALFEQSATVHPSPALCGMAGVILQCYATCFPSFLHSAPLERGQRCPRGTYDHQPGAHPGRRSDARRVKHSPPSSPILCGHPGRCGPIPGAMEPSLVLWGSVLMERHHAESCTARAPPSARPSNWHTGCDQAHALAALPSKPLPGEYRAAMTSAWTKICQDAIRSPTLYTGTMIVCKSPHGMPVSCLPLVYKRKRRTLGHGGGETILIRILLRTITTLILALTSIT
jgi:hypothetical protein